MSKNPLRPTSKQMKEEALESSEQEPDIDTKSNLTANSLFATAMQAKFRALI